MKYLKYCLLMLLFICGPLQAQDNPYLDYQQKAFAAYQEGNFEEYVEFIKRAHEINPNSPAVKYNLACGYALTDQPQKALELLQKLALAGLDFGMEADPDLESARELPGFEKIKALLQEKIEPVLSGKVYHINKLMDIMPEGIAYDSVADRFFYGSMHTGDVYMLDSSRNLYGFCSLPSDSPYSCLGLYVDNKRNTLWAVGTASNLASGYIENHNGVTGIFGYSLDDGSPTKRIDFPGKHTAFGFNDLTVAEDGTIFISGGPVYRIDPRRDSLELFIPRNEVYASNGITLSHDGRFLFIADYSRGIMKVDLRSGKHQWLEHSDSVSLAGIDGMYFHQNKLIAIQNITEPWSVIELYLSDDFDSVIERKILARGNPDLAEVFTAGIKDNRLYYVARGFGPENNPGQYTNVMLGQLGPTLIMTIELD